MIPCVACGAPNDLMGFCGNNNCPRNPTYRGLIAGERYDKAYTDAKPFTLLSWAQGFTLYELARAMPPATAMAEFGVYKGGGAMMMRAANPDAPLYLFDTFTGHPDNDRSKDRPGTHAPGSLGDTSAGAMRERIPDGELQIFKGYFPDSLGDAWKETAPVFGLVHIDVDIYESVKAGLAIFAPLVTKGGSIVLDDWQTHDCPGVVTAAEEWEETDLHLWRWHEEAYPTYQLVLTKC